MAVSKRYPVPKDIEIAQEAQIEPILHIARKLGLPGSSVELFGNIKAKIDWKLGQSDLPKRARYIDVTAISPTPLGEGKTTTTVGLVQGLGYRGHRAVATLRQPSMGPTFGIKGGAAGGGYSQVIPMEDINLHLTGDIHAVSAAHNLCAAAIDARLYHESRWSDAYFEKLGLQKLNIDPYRVGIGRVVDMNDRVLRHIITGLGDREDGPVRQSRFDISVASEVMAILALATDLGDLRSRIGRMVVAHDTKGKPLTAEDFGVAGAMTALLRDAIKPNLLQTLEGQPAFIHAGPFANIAHGNSSVIADQIAVRYADYVVTESGFGADMGMEKFFDIKCRTSGLVPDAVVVVATVRALKSHGGGPAVVPGKPLPNEYKEENLDLLRRGLSNLVAHLGIVKRFGIPAVVAINAFPTDTQAEWDLVRETAVQAGAFAAVVTHHWEQGGEGAADLAEAVEKACEAPKQFQYLYELNQSLTAKIETIARDVYGADGVDYSDESRETLEKLEADGFGTLPICMAKTQYSLSHDPALKGAPKGWRLPIREVRLAAGAGFVYPLCGDMTTMPGLPSKPAFMGIDIDESGKITGLS
ncbi:formate--tetrahydrofolate ligase [Gracilinema caldarium]|uniref:Formate--tetrahydrofolate ligase n=1 Tax=Gracilinema caldarium (strain ATCC 51460 / DSM 7334 / H1) TaxID=744872 RepID=F8F4F6_GRAC1|nr:formate--tetrahydrofolate ligase [Gracilinema caldarium]AEJ20603.1 Formate--tetrahydrofolate ligase [Gracilinema caldarium DSM 7334]